MEKWVEMALDWKKTQSLMAARAQLPQSV